MKAQSNKLKLEDIKDETSKAKKKPHNKRHIEEKNSKHERLF